MLKHKHYSELYVIIRYVIVENTNIAVISEYAITE